MENDEIKLGLENVEIGETYPFYGKITRVFEATKQGTVVEIDGKINLTMNLDNPDHVQKLKARAFELGIFVATVTATEPKVEGNCTTVVFGRTPNYSA